MSTNRGITCDNHGGILRITLDRPDSLNALNTPMLTELTERLADAASDDVRVVLLAGAGRAFCAGGDLTGQDTDGAVEVAAGLISAITALPKPVVAAIHGPAVGLGCSLALACDLTVVSRSAFFQLAFVRVGLMTDGAASLLVPAALGRPRAARLLMTGERLTAADAFDWGLISHLVEDESLQGEIDSLVADLAAGPTQAYRWMKRALALATLSRLPQIHELEGQGQGQLVATEDYRLAREAFAAQRKPHFVGR